MNRITQTEGVCKIPEEVSAFSVRLREEFANDFKPALRAALKTLLETSMEVQVQDLTGAGRWEHTSARRNQRNGYYYRSLLSSVGDISGLRVPRVRSGDTRFDVLDRYARRTSDVDALVRDMFLSGIATRKVREALRPLLGEQALSAATVSTIVKSLDSRVVQYHNRRLSDDWQYLILDGVYFNAKSPLHGKRRCVLVAYAMKQSGGRELVGFMLARNGESQTAWECFLSRLYYRGLEGKNLRLAVVDGNKGLSNAVETVYPFAKTQRCWAHKLRNAVRHVPRKLQKRCTAQARDIYNANSRGEAVQAFGRWAKTWRTSSPKAVRCIEDDLEELLNVYDCPAELRVKLRTTNVIERVFREVRRRTRPMSCFTNAASVERIVFAIFNRQNKIWEDKPLLKITHYS